MAGAMTVRSRPMRAGDAEAEALVRRLTQPTAAPLVPDVVLNLAAHSHDIWQTVEEVAVEAAKRPYWAFAWPGGQALARFLIDAPAHVAGRRVLDIGCGSGMGAIAAMKSGAASAIANDIDPLALTAARLNARANGVDIALDQSDRLGDGLAAVDVVLLADVVYEPDLHTRVGAFLERATKAGVDVLFADRGTTRLPVPPLAKLAEYRADVWPPMIDLSFERGLVWRLA